VACITGTSMGLAASRRLGASLGRSARDRIGRVGDPPVDVAQLGGGNLDARAEVGAFHGPRGGGHGPVADVRSAARTYRRH
jgi:hypothetical protein